jgi:hypothetical protein
VLDGVVDCGADQALRSLARHGLDADPRRLRETDLLDAHLVLEEADELARLR